MTFALHVDGARWRAHLRSVRAKVRDVGMDRSGVGSSTDIAPVIKGNGYGLGRPRLAREASALDVSTVCVGTVYEVHDAAMNFAGDVLILTPYEPGDTVAAGAWAQLLAGPVSTRVIRTASSPAGLLALAAQAGTETPTRVVIEGLTPMRRFGMTPAELSTALTDPMLQTSLMTGAVQVVGLALHLPLIAPEPARASSEQWRPTPADIAWPAGATECVRVVVDWARAWNVLLGDVQAAGADIGALSHAATLWVSHLEVSELGLVHELLPGTPIRVRVGTSLWLGDRGALQARGTVLAVHGEVRGDQSGYRQRRAAKDGTLLVIAGGTAHGVALEAPSAVSSMRSRVVAAGTGILEAGGKALSPFSISGKQRWFAEAPHMQVSLVRLPVGVAAPTVGDQVDCEIRLTTACFDAVIGLD